MGNIRGGMNGFLGTIGQPTAQVIDGSLKFKGGQYLERTSTAGNQTTWTWSGWIKASDLSGNNIFGEDGGYPNASAFFNSSGELRFTAAAADSSVFLNVIPSALFRDLSAWYHFVIVYDSGQSTSSERARIYVNGSRLTDLSTATYPSQNATTVVNSNGNAFRIGSHSGVDHLQGYMSQCYFIDGQALSPHFFGFTDPLTNTWRPKKFDAKGTTYNDGTTWSNFATAYATPANAFDGNTGTAALYTVADEFVFTPPKPIRGSSLRLYVNTGSGSPIDVSTNGVDFTGVFKLENGAQYSDLYEITDGLLTQLRVKTNAGGGGNIYQVIIDGEVLVDNTTTNLSFGVNGFHLPMDDEDRFRLDQSGKNNHFSEAGWSGTSIDPDVVKDSPSGAVFGGRGQTGITTTSSAPANYCTLNPLDKDSNIVLSNGNLDGAASGGDGNYRGTIPMKTGKFYWEITQVSGGNYSTYGIIRSTLPVATLNTDTITYRNDGFTKKDGVDGSTFNSISGDEVLGVACDCDNNQISYYKNNSLQTTITFTTEMTDDGVSAYGRWNNGKSADYNFGQKPFKYAPPQGFLPLNSASARPNTVVPRPNQYVGVTTYAGNTSSVVVKDLSFKPDLVWVKGYTDADRHGLYDTVRGVTKRLQSAHNSVEDTQNGVTSFNDNGFSIGNYGDSNGNGRGYVAWAWKAGGSKGTFNVDDTGHQYYLQSPMGASTPVYSGYCSGTQYSSTYSYAKAFDNSTSTVSFASNGNTITFTPPGGIANSGNILVTFDNGSVTDGGGSADFQINGSSVKSFFQTAITADGGGSGSSRVATITGITNITSMSWSRIADNDLFGVRKIVINGSETLIDGATIAPTGMSVGTKQGFSIIKYTGTGTAGTIPHGLLEQPKFVIIKDLKNTNSWAVQHFGTTLGTGLLKLDTNAASDDSVASAVWNSTAPTSSVFSVGTAGDVNYTTNSAEYITYLWHDVPGLQKFGSYEGNGNVDGPYVELGFKPAVLILKNFDDTENWYIYDTVRMKNNPAFESLQASSDSAQENGSTNTRVDILSTGFKLRQSNGPNNSNSYIYMAWAEAPASNLFGGQSNAR